MRRMETNMKSYCRIPPRITKSERFPEGGCPDLLYDLFEELKGANEIYIAAYLFNNPIFFEFLKNLESEGCNVLIISLPIRGYSDKKVKVREYGEKISGREAAEKIYEEINEINKIRLKIFPHMYMWYGARYAGGGASYSFHVKAIYAKFGNEKNKCILSSGNFMFTDPPHSDSLIILKNNLEYKRVFQKFFEDVEKFSVSYDEYKKNYKNAENDFYYSFLGKEINLSSEFVKNCFFTAPFYKVDGIGSNHYAGNRIIEIIKNAKRRIWVCSQHFHDLVSFDNSRDTIIRAIYDVSIEEPQLEMKFLKQVPHSSLADKRRAAIAETLFQFVLEAEQKSNRLVHDKFIIVDDTLIISTANYTSTQFAFGVRTMDMKFGNEKKRKQDNFSEVNGFVILPSCPVHVMNGYVDHFNKLWENGTPIRINL